MKDPSAAFFEELQRRGHIPVLNRANGTLRVDVVNGNRSARWFITMKKGDVTVLRQGGQVDCVIKGDRVLMEGIWSGKKNPMAAALRGDLAIEGDPQLMVLFQRVLPGPATSSHPRVAESVASQS
jgi:predicted lipid carrier protein YhbT